MRVLLLKLSQVQYKRNFQHDLISIFLQTADSDHDSSISCGFQVLNSTLRTIKYLSTGPVMFVGTSTSGIVCMMHLPSLYTSFCDTISKKISCRMKSSSRIFYEVTELLYYQVLQVVYRTLLENLELIRESKREGKEWMHIGKLKHLEQTIKLLTLQLGKFNSFLLEDSLNQVFKLHSR